MLAKVPLAGLSFGPYGIRILNAISEPSLEFRTLPIARRAC